MSIFAIIVVWDFLRRSVISLILINGLILWDGRSVYEFFGFEIAQRSLGLSFKKVVLENAVSWVGRMILVHKSSSVSLVVDLILRNICLILHILTQVGWNCIWGLVARVRFMALICRLLMMILLRYHLLLPYTQREMLLVWERKVVALGWKVIWNSIRRCCWSWLGNSRLRHSQLLRLIRLSLLLRFESWLFWDGRDGKFFGILSFTVRMVNCRVNGSSPASWSSHTRTNIHIASIGARLPNIDWSHLLLLAGRNGSMHSLRPDLLLLRHVLGILNSGQIKIQLLLRSSIFARCPVLNRHVLGLLRTSTSLVIDQRLGLNRSCSSILVIWWHYQRIVMNLPLSLLSLRGQTGRLWNDRFVCILGTGTNLESLFDHIFIADDR